MIKAVGGITGKEVRANKIAKNIEQGFNQLKTQNSKLQNSKPKTIYLIWKDPYITIGGDTFINDMLTQCGFQNIFVNEKRYPQLSSRQLSSVNCKLVLLPSEPYPFKKKHIATVKKLFPNSKLLLVDGEMFSWYGSRLQYAPDYFKQLHQYLKNTAF